MPGRSIAFFFYRAAPLGERNEGSYELEATFQGQSVTTGFWAYAPSQRAASPSIEYHADGWYSMTYNLPSATKGSKVRGAKVRPYVASISSFAAPPNSYQTMPFYLTVENNKTWHNVTANLLNVSNNPVTGKLDIFLTNEAGQFRAGIPPFTTTMPPRTLRRYIYRQHFIPGIDALAPLTTGTYKINAKFRQKSVSTGFYVGELAYGFGHE